MVVKMDEYWVAVLGWIEVYLLVEKTDKRMDCLVSMRDS